MARRGLGLRLPGPHLRRAVHPAARPATPPSTSCAACSTRARSPSTCATPRSRCPAATGRRSTPRTTRSGAWPPSPASWSHPRGQRRLRRPRPDVGAGRCGELAVPLAAPRRRHQGPGRQRLLRRRHLPQGLRAVPGLRAGQRRERRLVDPRPAPPARRRRQPQPRLLRRTTRATSSASTSGSPPSGRTTSTRCSTTSALDRFLLGSDWPHAEGTRQPIDFVTETLADVPADAVRKIARRTHARPARPGGLIPPAGPPHIRLEER